ncbi:MAG TPA: methyltransferase domain-containing protein [Gaiellaceae bacterium]|nr:methyltransferase domain-containing protein [Gaiellaceae bacterium]
MPVPPDVRSRLDALPEHALVLDVGGWASSDPRADWVIDIGPWETRGYYQELGLSTSTDSERVTEDTWVVRDISDPEPWPFDDDTFDYVICSHTLEDIRDPVRVCRELSRVAKAGYIETPNAAIEVTRGVESPWWCGWHHHRWLVRERDGGLTFLFKPHHIHSPFWPAVPSPKLLRASAAAHVSFRWERTFAAHEEVRVDLDDLDGELQAIARDAERRSSPRTNLRHIEHAAWLRYRRARALAGSVARRARR